MIPEMLGVMSDTSRVLSTSGSVGRGGDNHPADVRLIQGLLNLVPRQNGGPEQKLAVDGLVGPMTIVAISRYQSANLGFSDGRVDARNKTIRHLIGFLLSRQPIPDQPGMSVATANEASAIRCFLDKPFPAVRSSADVRSSLVGASSTGFGPPFTSTGWTINNNALSVDVTVKDAGLFVANLEIFQDADPTVTAKLSIMGAFKSVSPKASVPFGADLALPSFNSTQGMIIRGLTGWGPISKHSFEGVCQFGFIGGNLPNMSGRSVTLFQFGWVPAPAVPGNCLGFAVMVGDQAGIPGVSLGGGTGLCRLLHI
jgi:hypothetical protein